MSSSVGPTVFKVPLGYIWCKSMQSLTDILMFNDCWLTIKKMWSWLKSGSKLKVVPIVITFSQPLFHVLLRILNNGKFVLKNETTNPTFGYFGGNHKYFIIRQVVYLEQTLSYFVRESLTVCYCAFKPHLFIYSLVFKQLWMSVFQT